MMDGCKESDRFMVPTKPAHKGRSQEPAEMVEGRELAKGNVAEQTQEPDTAPGSPVT